MGLGKMYHKCMSRCFICVRRKLYLNSYKYAHVPQFGGDTGCVDINMQIDLVSEETTRLGFQKECFMRIKFPFFIGLFIFFYKTLVKIRNIKLHLCVCVCVSENSCQCMFSCLQLPIAWKNKTYC